MVEMEEYEIPEVADSESKQMSEPEAIRWLEQVDGTVFQNYNRFNPESAWVAVVEAPPVGGNLGRIIVGFGGSLQDATSVAETEWQHLWKSLSVVH
jgi:hypothetical protein